MEAPPSQTPHRRSLFLKGTTTDIPKSRCLEAQRRTEKQDHKTPDYYCASLCILAGFALFEDFGSLAKSLT